MFVVMQQQHQEKLKQMKESNNQALENGAAVNKSNGGEMTVMYNSVQADKKEKAEPNKEKGRRHQSKQNRMHPKGPEKSMHQKAKCCKHCNQVSRQFERYCFEPKQNEEHRPPNWKTMVGWNETEKNIVSENQRRRSTAIANSIRSSNNLAQSNAHSNFWYPLTGLVKEPADNTYYDFSCVLQNKLASGKPDAKAKSPPAP